MFQGRKQAPESIILGAQGEPRNQIFLINIDLIVIFFTYKHPSVKNTVASSTVRYHYLDLC